VDDCPFGVITKYLMGKDLHPYGNEAYKELFIGNIRWHNDLVVKLATFVILKKDMLPFVFNEWELLRQVVSHDFDKFADNYANAFVEWLPFYTKDRSVGIGDFLRKHGAHNHYETQRHHTRYHKVHNTIPTNLEIIEMVCDWVASSRKVYCRDLYMGVKSMWNIVYNDHFPETKEMIDKLGVAKFKSITDLFDSLNLDEEFFGGDPMYYFFIKKSDK